MNEWLGLNERGENEWLEFKDVLWWVKNHFPIPFAKHSL